MESKDTRCNAPCALDTSNSPVWSGVTSAEASSLSSTSGPARKG